MNRENFDFLYKMFPLHDLNNLDIIIVNQTTKNNILTSDIETVKVFNSFEKGLSKSRNLSLKNASKEWCLLSDDDLIYLEGFEKNIEKGIAAFKQSGIIIFEAIIDTNVSLRNYPKQSLNDITIHEIFHVASFEMLINRNLIHPKISFNENFGLGSTIFNSGEEQIFMFDMKEQLKLKASFFKQSIVVHPWLSTGREYNNKKRYFTKGGLYGKIFPSNYLKWILIQLFYDIKQGHIKLSQIYKCYKEAIQGVKKLKQINNEAY